MTKFYDFKNIKGDIFGGITAGIVALPLCLAFGVQSGMGAIAGLYGGIMLGIFAAIFGGTKTQVSGPTGPMTVVTAMVVASAIELTGSLQAGMGIIIASFMLASFFQILFGLSKIGTSIKYIPYPVLSGFMTGIGCIIILFQIFPIMGYAPSNDTLHILLDIDEPIEHLNAGALELGLLTIAIIYLFPKITKKIPSILVALVASTLLSVVLKLRVPVIGDIPTTLPQLRISELTSINTSYAWSILEFGVTLAALGALDSLLTAVIADNITKTKHNSNRELIGQGIGNFFASTIAGLPGAGATMRTVVNINAGGKTRLSGFLHGVFLLAVLLEFGTYTALIPLSVLAGILFTVGIDIIDYKGLKHLFRIPRTDAVILVTVLLITVFGNLLHAVGVGIVLACVLFMKQTSDLVESKTSVKALSELDSEHHWQDEESLYQAYKDKIFIKHLAGPLFFGFTYRFQEMIQELPDNVKVLIIRMGNVPYIDQSGVYALEDSIKNLNKKQVVVVFSGLQSQPLSMLKNIKVIPDLVPLMHVFPRFEDCRVWLKHNLQQIGAKLTQ